MKAKFFILVAVVATIFTSCKKSEEKPESVEAPKTEAKQNFSVEVDVTVEKDDDFALYFTEDNTIAFDDDHAVWAGAKAEKGNQKVIFNLSEEIIPTNIRLDFGLKKGAEQGDVTVHNVKVIYYGKSFEFKGSDFLKYFIENKDVKTQVDAAAGTIKFLKDPSGKFTPFYYPTQVIIDEIAKITK